MCTTFLSDISYWSIYILVHILATKVLEIVTEIVVVYVLQIYMRVVARTSAQFSRDVEGPLPETHCISGHFASYPQHVASGHDFDTDQLTDELNSAVENFNTRGSGFVIDDVSDFTLVITQHRPLSTVHPHPTLNCQKASHNLC